MFRTNVVKKIKTHILCSVTFPENSNIFEIMWKKMVVPSRTHMPIWLMHISRWVSKAKNAHIRDM